MVSEHAKVYLCIHTVDDSCFEYGDFGCKEPVEFVIGVATSPVEAWALIRRHLAELEEYGVLLPTEEDLALGEQFTSDGNTVWYREVTLNKTSSEENSDD